MKFMQLIFYILGGAAFAILTGTHLEQAGWYNLLVTSLLVVGLYASTFGIDIREARQHLRIIVSAVTLGVVMKALIIGASLSVLFGDPFFFVLGVVVAQIDPLSVSWLMRGKRLSSKAKTILASWASFDDPITVLLSLYVPLLVVQLTGADIGTLSQAGDVSLTAYFNDIGVNIAFAAGVFMLWLLAKYYAKKTSQWVMAAGAMLGYLALAVVLSLSALYFLMLGIALIGLFLRPRGVSKTIDHIVVWALRIAAVCIGLLLSNGIALWKGLALGIAAYVAQILVGFLLTRGLEKRDRWHIAFAQQNGMTAIVLALLFEPIQPGTVAIVAPAIVVINGLHGIANHLIDTRILVKN